MKKQATQGLVVVNTGNGKGKTTAALGMALRAWGHGMRICIIQFIKKGSLKCGEHLAAEKLGIEVIKSGDGFTWQKIDLSDSEELARQGWHLAKEKILSGAYDLIILDEMTYCFKFDWLDFEEVKNWLIQNKPSGLHVVITGRDASAELIEFADLVTEMNLLKHPFEETGLKGQKGIEF